MKNPLPILGIGFAALVVRLYGLGERGKLWEDELAVYEYALTGDATGVPSEAPLYTALQTAWMWWTHDPTANTMQLLSIGLGVAGVFAAYALAGRFADRSTALLTAALLAVAPLSIVLSHEVRPYTLYIATSALLLLAFDRAWSQPSRVAWFAYAAALAVALSSHLLATQLCIALGAAAVFGTFVDRDRDDAFKRFAIFAAVSVAAGLLGLLWLLYRPSQAWLLTGPHVDGVLDFLGNIVMSLGGGTRTGLWPAGLVFGLAAIGAGVLARRNAMRAFLLVSAIAIPATITWANLAPMSSGNWHGWQRYLAHLLIPFLLLTAVGTLAGAHLLAERVEARWRPAVTGVLCAVPFVLMWPGFSVWLEQPIRHKMVDNLDVYATFACQNQHRVLGHLLIEVTLASEPWLSHGQVRRRFAYDLARHDLLPAHGVGREGVYDLEPREARFGISERLTPVEREEPPNDGPYLVFPPTLGCDALMQPPARGIESATSQVFRRWGLICDVRFERL